jgi:type II secretory pathway component HofQ
MFKELFTESKKPTVANVKKIINGVSLDILMPQAFEVDLFNTDAGIGGEKVVRVIPRSTRNKDKRDVDKVKKTLSTTFDLIDKNGVWILR